MPEALHILRTPQVRETVALLEPLQQHQMVQAAISGIGCTFRRVPPSVRRDAAAAPLPPAMRCVPGEVRGSRTLRPRSGSEEIPDFR
eukprot:gene13928-biopygen4456